MAVNLSKGGRVDLAKEVPSLKKVRVGLGWKENKFSTGGAYDIDVTAFMLQHDASGNAKCKDERSIIFYNNLKSACGSVIHTGDNRTGDAAEDDEVITVDIAGAVANCDEISFIITIHDAVAKKQNFGQIEKAYVKLYDDADGTLIAQYDLENDFSGETSVQIGSLFKRDGKMLFKAVGQGFNAGLADFCKGYGLEVA